MKTISAIAIALGLASLVMPAAAQRVGQYSGTTADGNTVYLSFNKDSGSGKFQLTNLSVNFNSPCKGAAAGSSLASGIGISPTAGQVLVANKQVSYHQLFSNFYVSINFTFTDSNTIAGFIDVISSELVPVQKGKPKQTAFCESPSQKMSLKFSPSTVAPVPANMIAAKH